MFQHGTRLPIYCTYMLYIMIKSTFNMCGTRQKYGIQYLWSYFLTTVSLCIIYYTGDRTRSHKTIAKKDSICRLAIMCSLTTSKSAKLCTKLAVLIITHAPFSTVTVACILYDPFNYQYCVYELVARAQDYLDLIVLANVNINSVCQHAN